VKNRASPRLLYKTVPEAGFLSDYRTGTVGLSNGFSNHLIRIFVNLFSPEIRQNIKNDVPFFKNN